MPTGQRARIGLFVAVAIGFCTYAALTAAAMFRVKEPSI
jgi:hypothetical protein